MLLLIHTFSYTFFICKFASFFPKVWVFLQKEVLLLQKTRLRVFEIKLNVSLVDDDEIKEGNTVHAGSHSMAQIQINPY